MSSLRTLLPALLAANVVSASPLLEKRLNNSIGRTPAMGFNNFNARLPSSAETALNAADQMISLGLKDAGYVYVNIDDRWSTKDRDDDDNLVPDPDLWPDGIEAVTKQIHDKGMKFGLYGDSGTETCAEYPGSEGYEEQDAQLLADWGVDYWKYDNCATTEDDSRPRYEKMRDALAATGRDILYSLCQWGENDVWEWGAEVGNSWRIDGDIQEGWDSAAAMAAVAAGLAEYAQPGGFNDLDMLEIGNAGLSTEEERAHFGLWAIAKSPLLIGTNLTSLSDETLKILKNEVVISINQDSLGKPATTFQPPDADEPEDDELYPYWVGELSDGFVVAFVAADGADSFSVNFSDIDIIGDGTFDWTEAYTGDSGSGTSVSADLEEHDMAIFKLTPA